MLVQGDQIRNVFEKLQQAVNPVPVSIPLVFSFSPKYGAVYLDVHFFYGEFFFQNPGRTGDYSKINEGSQYNLPSTEDTERLDNRKFDAD